MGHIELRHDHAKAGRLQGLAASHSLLQHLQRLFLPRMSHPIASQHQTSNLESASHDVRSGGRDCTALHFHRHRTRCRGYGLRWARIEIMGMRINLVFIVERFGSCKLQLLVSFFLEISRPPHQRFPAHVNVCSSRLSRGWKGRIGSMRAISLLQPCTNLEAMNFTSISSVKGILMSTGSCFVRPVNR